MGSAGGERLIGEKAFFSCLGERCKAHLIGHLLNALPIAAWRDQIEPFFGIPDSPKLARNWLESRKMSGAPGAAAP